MIREVNLNRLVAEKVEEEIEKHLSTAINRAKTSDLIEKVIGTSVKEYLDSMGLMRFIRETIRSEVNNHMQKRMLKQEMTK